MTQLSFLKNKNKEVVFDAEVFFEGYKANTGVCDANS